MAEAAASYPTGRSVTRTTAPQAMPYEYAIALMGAQDKYRSDMDAWSRAMAAASVPRATNYAAAPQIGRSDVVPRAAAPSVMRQPAPPAKSALGRARERAELLKAMALTNGPRMYYTQGGFNNPQHLEMDIDHMSPIERALFLPQSSSFVPDDVALMRARYGYR